MLYILQVTLYTAIMLLIYFLFLRNSSQYTLSRGYLLASAMAPLVIPFLRLPQTFTQGIQRTGMMQVELPTVMVSVAHKVSSMPTATTMLWVAYGAITLLLIMLRLSELLKLRRVITTGKKEKFATFTLVASCGYGPGSFGRYVLFPGEEVDDTILAHEQAHIRMHHTRDIMLVTVLKTFLWPNIFLIWIGRELRQVHEFQADATANIGRENYLQLLLSSVFHAPVLPVMHLFIIHPIKRRIMMLQKKGTASPVKALAIVCSSLAAILLTALTVQSCSKGTTAASNSGAASAGTASKQAVPVQPAASTFAAPEESGPDKNGVYTYVHQMPAAQFDISSYMRQNIHYPEDARKNKLSGKVIVRFTVDVNGKVSNPECVRSVGPSLDKEALRIVSSMPDWTPGEKDGKKVPVYFYLPILFSTN